MLEYPKDPATYGLDDEVMFGRDVLVAPVVWPGASERSVYLPAGTWVDYWTGAAHHADAQRLASQLCQISALPIGVEPNLAACRFHQPVDTANQRRLAGTGRTDDGCQSGTVDGEIDTFKDGMIAFVFFY